MPAMTIPPPETIAFYVLAGITVISGILVVTLKHIFHCALWLILSLVAVAGLFLLLNAEFLAAVQILIYVGAITVLILFAVMLTYRISDRNIRQANSQSLLALFIMVMLGTVLVYTLWKTSWEVNTAAPEGMGISGLGKVLLTTYVLPFEVVSVLLLSALVGAITIARKETG